MKRVYDFTCAMIALILLSPLYIIVAFIIKIDSSGPVVFTQRRVGVNDKEFIMYKFRTMAVGTPEVATDKLKDSQQYITNIGYYLRKYSLDEMPQLFNILLGDMSLVGPRPALYNQYDLRAMRNKQGVSQIRPGLTGWAQINGRDEISLEQKIALDTYYVQRQSFLLDLFILYRTVFSVYAGNGINIKI